MHTAKVLIVDDDPIVREFLSQALSTVQGYETDISSDGVEGIEKVKNNQYDLVFTDLFMPRLNGVDFLKEVKKLDLTLPVVMITGFSTVDNAINAIREGASDFIEKPFKADKVLSIAEKFIGQRRLLGKIASPKDYESSLERVNIELFNRLQKISILQVVNTELDQLYDNGEVYQNIVQMASKLLVVHEVSFGVVDNGYLKIKGVVGPPVKDRVRIEGTYLESVVKTKKYSVIKPGEVSPFTGQPLTFPLLSIPFTMNDETFAILSLSNKTDGTAFTDDEIYLALTFTKRAALRIENNALYESIYGNLINTLKSLVSIIEVRDPYTKQHSERVTAYALAIAEVLKLSTEEKDIIRFGGFLHDIGKIGVRDIVLLKPGKLTPEEMAEVKLHPVIGENIIKPMRFLQKEREIILYHHERIDGKGYPYGIGGSEIPLLVRILSVADVYDAITSSRAYRPAKTHEFAIGELKLGSDKQFDSEVVEAFLQTPAGRGKKYGA